jgi:FkbM family methyltransferase
MNNRLQINLRTLRMLSNPAKFIGLTALSKVSTRLGVPAFEGTYALDAHSIVLRHGTMDNFTFKEIFVLDTYDFPEQVQNRLLGRPVRILDLGGNIGFFTVWACMNLDVESAMAFEPDPENARQFRRHIDANGLPCSLREACAGNVNGSVRFEVGEENAGSITDSGKGIEVPLVDVLPLMYRADLIKMDIEGAEWHILADPRFQDIHSANMVLEYHPHMCPSSDPRDAALGLLSDAGFTIVEQFYDTSQKIGLLWAWK